MKKKKGFFDRLIEDLVYQSAIEAARDPHTGKVDPYAAAGIAFGSGKMQVFEDQMHLAAHLGTAGAFDADDEETDYEWRDFCEDGSSFGVFPEDYETEDEYELALEEAKYGWRDTAEDGSEYGLDPADYETKTDYAEALEEAKYAWRDEAEDGSEYGLDPTDYETEEEYSEALEEARNGWRDEAEDGSEYGLSADDFDTQAEYEDALEEAQQQHQQPVTTDWSRMSSLERRKLEASLCEMDYHEYMDNVRHYKRFGLDPDDYEQPGDYFRLVAASIRDAEKLKELITRAKNAPIRSAAEKLYCIKYDFGIAYASPEDKLADIKRFERVLKDHYVCEVPNIPRKKRPHADDE